MKTCFTTFLIGSLVLFSIGCGQASEEPGDAFLSRWKAESPEDAFAQFRDEILAGNLSVLYDAASKRVQKDYDNAPQRIVDLVNSTADSVPEELREDALKTLKHFQTKLYDAGSFGEIKTWSGRKFMLKFLAVAKMEGEPLQEKFKEYLQTAELVKIEKAEDWKAILTVRDSWGDEENSEWVLESGSWRLDDSPELNLKASVYMDDGVSAAGASSE